MKKNGKPEYPVIFVHGMFGWGENEGINKKAPYWGATSGSIIDYLSDEGVECYAASVGPMSSAWDQACELYAQLTGTMVDYGEAHSAEHGHKRYGRRYKKPLFDGWSNEKKIHLIGHSFGGNSSRMLAHLLTNGAPEEVKVSGDDASPLFLGGRENLICSVTAICSPLDGTKAYETASKYKLIEPLKFLAYNYAGFFGRTSIGHRFADFHLEHFGLIENPDTKDKESFKKAIKKLFDTNDSIAYDMYAQGSKELNRKIHISPSVFYFSYPFNAVDAEKNKAVNTDFILMKATASLMLHDSKKGDVISGNDGLVDVESAKHPSTEPFKDFDEDNIKCGMWNVMPVSIGDHGTPIGLFAEKNKMYSFYNRHIYLLSDVEKINKEAAEL